MPSEGQGRFCAACSKTVVDLTGFSDQELLAFLGRQGKTVVGGFLQGRWGGGWNRGWENAPRVGGDGWSPGC